MPRTTMPSTKEWLTGGDRIAVRGRAGEHRLFVRQDGPPDGLPVTLLHGFPTSSHDWSPIVPRLVEAGCRVLNVDMLGFGDSDKPRSHRYSVLEQADLVEAVWEKLGVGDTALVAHDYGVSVGQELLARDPLRVLRMAWLNGGLYPDLHRPVPMQRLLHGPLGVLLRYGITERSFCSSLRGVFGAPVGDEDLHRMWEGVARRHGQLLAPRLLRYIDDRRTHQSRWIAALESYPRSTLFLWGPADPISGAHVLPRLRERMPHAVVHELSGPPAVGHYPQVEAPEEVGRVLAAFLRRP
ncbi:alpha/beta fold hydrolase [Streptomyces sp. ODS05-4]|uniref:alpha/beta fold hydrolase n=1 Tax=Streptomyces sp. ODS05-4 TaxID=2944939 RepID=UPI00210BC133|nr:alpha/beta fold hydrolase [Streptomyces sp. ODS05-4]